VRSATDDIEARLRTVATPERAAHEKAYLKSDLEFLGASVPAIRKVAKEVHGERDGLAHDDLVALVDALWDRGIHELRMTAVELLGCSIDVLSADDAPLLERLLRESRTWALVDGLAAGVIGRLVPRDDRFGAVLDRWATGDDFWLRRSALLALLVPLRAGAGDWERFGRYADAMLEEKEFFIRKAIGWVLRDTARKRPEMVRDWLLPRAARASGVTLREAVKPLSIEDRERVLAAARG
jgi:3-methyladenine DNA glycosylase AlkD